MGLCRIAGLPRSKSSDATARTAAHKRTNRQVSLRFPGEDEGAILFAMDRQPESRRLSVPWRTGIISLILLFMAFVWTAGLWVWVSVSRSRVTTVLAEQPTVRSFSTLESGAMQEGIPLADLHWVGGLFSADLAKREDIEERIRQVGRFSRACRQPGDGPLDYRQVLRDLRVNVPEGMTNEAAVAEFLRRATQVRETLALFRQDLERGPWDWGQDIGRKQEEWPQRNKLIQLLRESNHMTLGLGEAEWLSRGDHTGVAGLKSIRLVAEQSARLNDMVGLQLHADSLGQSAILIRRGISQEMWSDEELAQIASAMPAIPTLRQARDAMEAKKLELRWRMESSSALEEVRASLPSTRWGRWRSWDDFEVSMARTFLTDTHIRDGFAVAIADVDEEISRMNIETGTYTPGDRMAKPSAIIRNGAEGWERGLIEPIREIVSTANLHAGWMVTSSERDFHQAHYVTALEMHRKQHGDYPATLDDLKSASGPALPRKSLTGDVYQYERVGEAGYRLMMGNGPHLLPPGMAAD